MRQLHPRTIQILAEKGYKAPIAHCWSEQFKAIASGKKHPKVFIDDEHALGKYLFYVYIIGTAIGCKFNATNIRSLPISISESFFGSYEVVGYKIKIDNSLEDYFDDNYLFSDAVSLYFKGINIFPDIFGDNWRKYVPVESLKEINRQVTKTLKGQNK